MRDIKRSGRGEESWILTTPQAEVFPVRWNKTKKDIYFVFIENFSTKLTKTYVICYDREFHGITGIQAIAASLNLSHVEEQFFPFVNFIVQKAKLAFDGVHDSALLVANSSNLKESKIFHFDHI